MSATEDLLTRIKSAAAKYDQDVLPKNPALREAETHSAQELQRIKSWIGANPPPPTVHTLATAGSLARREASGASDIDLIVITHDQPTPEEGAVISAWRTKLCEELAVEPPNPTGVFAAAISHTALANSAGYADEAYQDVSKRVLLLLESEPLYKSEAYDALLTRIIEKYAYDISRDPRKNFVFLLNDVIRFFRALCVNYQYTKSEVDGLKWPLRNTKLRHSRVILYFSMVSVIGVLSREHGQDKIAALREFVGMTALRRLAVVYRLSGDGAFFKVAQFYNQFLTVLCDKDSRQELQGLDYDGRYKSNVFAQLKANSDGLSSELLRFYEARRREWDDRFFEYMIL